MTTAYPEQHAWDPDGQGVRRIEDKKLAGNILKKFKRLHQGTAWRWLVLSALPLILPPF